MSVFLCEFRDELLIIDVSDFELFEKSMPLADDKLANTLLFET